jgi:hypothetical protein
MKTLVYQLDWKNQTKIMAIWEWYKKVDKRIHAESISHESEAIRICCEEFKNILLKEMDIIDPDCFVLN